MKNWKPAIQTKRGGRKTRKKENKKHENAEGEENAIKPKNNIIYKFIYIIYMSNPSKRKPIKRKKTKKNKKNSAFLHAIFQNNFHEKIKYNKRKICVVLDMPTQKVNIILEESLNHLNQKYHHTLLMQEKCIKLIKYIHLII